MCVCGWFVWCETRVEAKERASETQNHYHNIHFGIEIAHSAFEFDLFFSCCYFP